MRLADVTATLFGVALIAMLGCTSHDGGGGTGGLACGPETGLASSDWEVEAIELGDSLAHWHAQRPGLGPYPDLLERLRTYPALREVAHPERVEGHAFLRAMGSIGADVDFVPRLARTLRQEVLARRLTLRDVTSATGGPDREPILVASALFGIPDSLLAFAGAGTVLCQQMQRLLPLFDRGFASYYSDLGEDAGPFVANFKTVHDAGPAGRAIIDTIVRAASPFPGLAAFVHRLHKAVQRPDTSEASF